MRFAVGGCRPARGRPTPSRPSPLRIPAAAAHLLCALLLLAAAPVPVAAVCAPGDVRLSATDCARVCPSSRLLPCTSLFGLTCGSWFWRRACCRAQDVRTCSNGREWASCYCDLTGVRPAGVVLLVAASLGALVGLAALVAFFVRRRKARAAAARPPVYGEPLGGFMPPPPPPPVVPGYPAGGAGGGGGYPGYPQPAANPGWGGGGAPGAPPPGYPTTSG